jgi:hypothetical protein
MIPPFDQSLLERQFRRFAEQVPRVLRQSKLTEDLAAEVERSLAISEAPFTLAIVGPMRVGKSTLINALAGADLALPGVTETTATINWFRHGTPDQARRFRVVWNDDAGTGEEFDIAERHRWSGNSELAARTRYLEFFSPAEFLTKVHVIDTPGTRSTLTAHEEAARGFLLAEGKAARNSLHYGGGADCIVYVLPPVAHQTDRDLLGEFSARQRFPQSTPYNSVGVLHKWDTLDDRAPWLRAVEQSRRAFDALKSCLCDVVPVSAPLARASVDREAEFWVTVLRLVRGLEPSALGALTIAPSRFTREQPGCPLGAAERAQLQAASGLPWECFKTILAFASSSPIADGPALRQAIRELSGLDQLLALLDNRFLSRARMIRAANVMTRALRIGGQARGRLRNRLADHEELQELGRLARSEISPTMSKAQTYLDRTLRESVQESESLARTLAMLEPEARAIRRCFTPFAGDGQAVRLVDEFPGQFDRAELPKILTILGAYGSNGVPIDDLYEQLDRWLVLRHGATGERQTVLDQVVRRLELAIHEALRPCAEITEANGRN